MTPDSISDSPFSRSTIAGILLFGLMARNSGVNCSSWLILTLCTAYSTPSSSSMMDTLRPFGVDQV